MSNHQKPEPVRSDSNLPNNENQLAGYDINFLYTPSNISKSFEENILESSAGGMILLEKLRN
ncbi:MAG TPA: hypothetical protein PK707_02070 [Candidatus Syntrophosphaera thermopropionivorans]|jgi:hypothetical protein|nr:hypothetical protein [Candidatus Cloacimonadota bacterium]HQF81629.1 hypothetical protein [Candidatus Syntrophosphaera thermopropionivorans]HQH47769.1 hypothetical protein [Candidatus Syntrophosphaera thermopropionivorans]HRD00235.1 hypothetical protein [Candidatus Syntrophosphaera thermopropionivorans]